MSKVIPPSPSARFVIPDDKFEITKLTAYIKPVQDGDGEPSSENIRPIKGWDKVTVFNDTIYDRPILYNQKFTTDGSTSSGGGVTYTNEGNGYWRLTNNGTGTNRKQITGATGESIYVTPVNHIVYACSNAGIDGSTSTFQLYFSYSGGNSQTSNAKEGTLLRRTGTTGIGQYSIRTYSSFRPPEGGLLMRPVCYDLTQMFGEDVAEQILAMETAHAGDGIAWFKNLLPDDYYPPKINNGTEFTCISKIRELPYKEFEVTLPSTVYGGNIDLVSGVLTVDRGYIASYDGETLPSTWISDRDVYAEGTTPTTGAQVVYTLAEPVIYNLTPVEVDYFVGINQLFATSGNISLEYLKDTRKRIKLNGVDMTDYFTPRGMKVSYVKVQGENGGTYLSGDREEDVLAWKAAVTLTCMPLTPEQQSEILIKATSENPSLYYFDPRKNAYRTIHYMASLEEMMHRGIGGTGLEFWTGLVLTADEKSEFAIVAQPEDASGAIGETAYFSVTVSGSDLTYRWQFYNTNTNSWGYVTSSAYSGLRTPTMGVPITATRDGYRYRCEIKDGNETIYSNEATLSVETE